MHAVNGNMDSSKRGIKREQDGEKGSGARAESRSPRRPRAEAPMLDAQELERNFAGLEASYTGAVGTPQEVLKAVASEATTESPASAP
eukprot:2630158-Alexandrium_andersonii.AAC.1